MLGLVIIGFSVVANAHGKPFKEMLSGQITIVTIILIVVGVLVFFIAFLGCCGAIKESHCMLTMVRLRFRIIMNNMYIFFKSHSFVRFEIFLSNKMYDFQLTALCSEM